MALSCGSWAIRVWSEEITSGKAPEDALLFLVTTAIAPEGQAPYYLRTGPNTRDERAALERLNSTAHTSTNRSLTAAFEAFKNLRNDQKTALISSVKVLDGVAHIQNMDEPLREAVFGFAPRNHLNSYLQRLEGWWQRQIIKQLMDPERKAILGEELEDETSLLREQFKDDSLPIVDDIIDAWIDEEAYKDKVFVEQLKIIFIGNPRIAQAIKDYYRAFEHRSRWTREELLLVGDLDRYERRLIERQGEWNLRFAQMQDELGKVATEEAKIRAAKALYKWIEVGPLRQIRERVTEPSIARGSYQMLSDKGQVGWHHDFAERVKDLLEARNA